MAIVNLHDITGKLFEVDARTMLECKELPDYTELSYMQRIQGLTRYPTVKEVKVLVQEKKAEIRHQLLKNKDVMASIPSCLFEQKTFEQLRAERRAKQTNP